MKSKKQAQRPSEGPRKAAWRILLTWEAGSDALEAIRDRHFIRGARLDIRDRALITELTQGTVRHQLFLDHSIKNNLERPELNLPAPVMTALRLGAYQLIHLHKIPAHAAVKETVQIIKESRYRRFAPLVNAVLRKISDRGPAPIPVLNNDPEKHIELATSTPMWLVKRLADLHGHRETLRILQSLNRTPPLTLRVNTTRTDRHELMRTLEEAGVPASPGRLTESAVILENRLPVWELPVFKEGLCTIQDEGAQLIAPLLKAEPGHTVLDACSAPGGKTSHLVEFMAASGLIIAADRSLKRLQMMVSNLERLGTGKTGLVAADLSKTTIPFSSSAFDRVLLDAPCSGTGVLRRHPEGKWRKDPHTISLMTGIQEDLLASAAGVLKTGGRLLYTTCSLLPEENEAIVDHCLSELGSLVRIDMREEFPEMRSDVFTDRGELRLWPHIHDCDGFYACLMEKKA